MLPADCLENVVNTTTEEIVYQKASLLRRPLPKIVQKDAW